MPAPLDKENVLLWFKDLPGSKRVDLMCSMFTMCVPFELHFFGTVINGLNKKDSKDFRDTEIECNNISNVLDFRDIVEDVSRQKTVIQLALLHSNNRHCASSLFRMLTLPRSVNAMSFITQPGVNFELSSGIIAELLLVYTLAANHPAFKYEEQKVLSSILLQLTQFDQCLRDQMPVLEQFESPAVPAEPQLESMCVPLEVYDQLPLEEPVKSIMSDVQHVGPHLLEVKSVVHGNKLEANEDVAYNFPPTDPETEQLASLHTEPRQAKENVEKAVSPAPRAFQPSPVCLHIVRLSLHRIVSRRGSDKRTDADIEVLWSDGKQSLVRLSSNDLQKFHRKVETLVTEYDASPVHEKKHPQIPRFPGAGHRTTTNRIVLKSETLGEYLDLLMKACPDKVLHSEEVAKFLKRYSGRAQPQDPQKHPPPQPPVPGEENWEDPVNFNDSGSTLSPQKLERTPSPSSSDEKPPTTVNSFVIFNSKLDTQSQVQPCVSLPGIAPTIVRFGAHGVAAPRAARPPHVPLKMDERRLKSPIISPDAEAIASRSSTPGQFGSPLTSPLPPTQRILANGNESSSSEDSNDSTMANLPKRVKDKEKLRELFSKEKFKKYLPELSHYTLTQLRDLPDEQYEKHGLPKSAVDKIRRMLSQVTITGPNGYYRPVSRNGYLEPVDSSDVAIPVRTPEPPATVQTESDLPGLSDPVISPVEHENVLPALSLNESGPLPQYRSQLRPRPAIMNAVRPPPARFAPIFPCPRSVMNSRPVPWPPVLLPPPQRPAEPTVRSSTSGSEVSSPPQSMGSSPAISPATTPGPNAQQDMDRERQIFTDPLAATSSQYNGYQRHAARATPPMPTQGRLVGISPIPVNSSPYQKNRHFPRRDSLPRTNPMQQKQLCYVQFYPFHGDGQSNSMPFILPAYPVQGESQSYVPILNPPPFYHSFVPVQNTLVPLLPPGQNGYMPDLAYQVPPPVVPTQKEPTPPEQTRTPPVISCFNCGLLGHRGQDCSEPTFDDIATQNRS